MNTHSRTSLSRRRPAIVNLSLTIHHGKANQHNSSLPVEIRLQIWELALVEPRIFRLRNDKAGHPYGSHIITPLLGVCRKSRVAALKANDPRTALYWSTTYFNYKESFLYFGPHSYFGRDGFVFGFTGSLQDNYNTPTSIFWTLFEKASSVYVV